LLSLSLPLPEQKILEDHQLPILGISSPQHESKLTKWIFETCDCELELQKEENSLILFGQLEDRKEAQRIIASMLSKRPHNRVCEEINLSSVKIWWLAQNFLIKEVPFRFLTFPFSFLSFFFFPLTLAFLDTEIRKGTQSELQIQEK